MISSIILSSLDSNLKSIQKNDLLQINSKSKEYGLILTDKDVEEIIQSRNSTLKNYGRIELNIDVTKKIIENLYLSQYTDKDDYVELINDLQEIFYYLKNETLDEISDIEILEIIDDFYNRCNGRIDNVQDMSEQFSHNYRSSIGGINNEFTDFE